MSEVENTSIREFWDQRASLGNIAGTNDFILTSIEQRFLLNYIKRNSRVLDAGCGNGSSLIKLVTENECCGVGIDFSDKMIETASAEAAKLNMTEKIEWCQHELPPVPNQWGEFDIVYSQRSLINLATTELQKQAVLSVADSLKLGGEYLMIECFNDGAEETNKLRESLGLDLMEAPWHNLFFNLEEVKSWSVEDFYVDRIVHLSSLYHLLSRVIYAKLANDSGEELVYDSKINLLASQASLVWVFPLAPYPCSYYGTSRRPGRSPRHRW